MKRGEEVTAGQTVAILARPDLLNEIKVAEQALQDLNTKYNQLATLAQQQMAWRQAELDKQRQA